MRQMFKICLLAVMLCSALSAHARNLYSIIAADTGDTKVGMSVLQDYNHVRLKLQEIANHTGLDLKEINFKGINNQPSKLLKQLHSVEIQDDDVVVFYYAGHGYRTENKGRSPWPNLYFSKYNQGIKYETVMDILNEKNPRLLITIADICNSYIDDSGAPPLVTRATPEQNENLIKENYRRLFLEPTGRIYITSSKPGETASGYEDGGLYTNAFLNSLTFMVKNSQDAQWQAILARAYSLVKSIEHPYSEVSL